MAERTWTIGGAASVAGVDREQIKDWRRNNHFVAQTDEGFRKGPGWDRFSLPDLISLATLGALTKQGMSISSAAKIVREFPPVFRRIGTPGYEDLFIVFAFDANKEIAFLEAPIGQQVLLADIKKWFKRIADATVLNIVDIGAIRSEVLHRIGELDKRARDE